MFKFCFRNRIVFWLCTNLNNTTPSIGTFAVNAATSGRVITTGLFGLVIYRCFRRVRSILGLNRQNSLVDETDYRLCPCIFRFYQFSRFANGQCINCICLAVERHFSVCFPFIYIFLQLCTTIVELSCNRVHDGVDDIEFNFRTDFRHSVYVKEEKHAPRTSEFVLQCTDGVEQAKKYNKKQLKKY